MTGQWINQQPQAGGAADLWTEGPNLVHNGDFETAMPDLPFDDTDWTAFFNNETAERVTVGPIAGAASLHVLTTGEPGESEGVYWQSGTLGDVHSRDVIRFRFTIAGVIGTVRAVLKLSSVVQVGGSIRVSEFIPYLAEPGITPETYQWDLVCPESGGAAFGQAGDDIDWYPQVQFFSLNEIADFTIDDVGLYVLTPA